MIPDLKKKLKSGVAKTSFVALATAFGAVSGSPAFAKDEDTTLWKTQTFDAVIAMKPCPGSTGVCGEIHWLNPADHKLFEYFGDQARRTDTGPVTDDEVKALCGFTPKIDFRTLSENHWQGTMELRGKNMTVNVDAVKTGDRTMQIDTSKFLIHQSETWTRVDANDPRYPKCDKPKTP